MGCYVLLSAAYIYQKKYQTKHTYTLSEFAIMLSETVLERISLIDLLGCTQYNVSKARAPDSQLLLFLPDSTVFIYEVNFVLQ